MTFNTVRDILFYAAEQYGDRDFIRFIRDGEVQSKSFSRFKEDSLAMCRYIRSVDPNRRHIGFIGKTSYEYVVCLTAMILSGNVVIPFDPNITVEEAITLFADGDIEMLFCEEDARAKAEQISMKYPELNEIVSLGDWKWFESIFEKYNSQSEYASLSDVEVNPDDMTLIIYTSGTTGMRKGVMLTNRNLGANTTYINDVTDGDDVCLSVLPMHHVFCYACDVLRTLYDGTALALNGRLQDLFKNLLIFEPTCMRIVPALCKSLMTRMKIIERKNPWYSKRECADAVFGKRLNRLIVGSAFISAAMIDEFEKYGIKARMGYGMSECSPRITTNDWNSIEHKHSTGKLLGTDQVRIQDGEVQVKGPSVMKGYYKREKATKDAFTEDGWLKTGDLGRIEDNFLYLLGRKKNIIVLSNGENISPEEIENKFVDDSIIKESIVVGKNDHLVAKIVLNDEIINSRNIENPDEVLREIIDRVNKELASDRQLFGYEICDKPFPRTSTGKIKRTEFLY